MYQTVIWTIEDYCLTTNTAERANQNHRLFWACVGPNSVSRSVSEPETVSSTHQLKSDWRLGLQPQICCCASAAPPTGQTHRHTAAAAVTVNTTHVYQPEPQPHTLTGSLMALLRLFHITWTVLIWTECLKTWRRSCGGLTKEMFLFLINVQIYAAGATKSDLRETGSWRRKNSLHHIFFKVWSVCLSQVIMLNTPNK